MRSDSPSEEPYRLYKKDYETEEEARAQQRAVDQLVGELINFWYCGVIAQCGR
jgi:hypothetical protein